MNAETGEGEDPCHEEQLSARPAARWETGYAADEEAPAPSPSGLNLSWTDSEVARGFVMGEILKRK
jgi:hypothetical protein